MHQTNPSSAANKGVNELFRTEVLTPFQEDLLEKSKEIYNGANILITGRRRRNEVPIPSSGLSSSAP